MKFITAEDGQEETLKIEFIKKHLSEIKMLAKSSTAVHFFNFIQTDRIAILDETTWSDNDDFTNLSEELICWVFIYSNY